MSRSDRGFRHVLVLGPNCSRQFEPLDDAMVVLRSEPQLVSLIEACDAIISAGGYNTVSEIRAARVPAFLLPARRRHDDQAQRARRLESTGGAIVAASGNPVRIAHQFCDGLMDPAQLAAMRSALNRQPFVPGNRRAAEILLECAAITQSC